MLNIKRALNAARFRILPVEVFLAILLDLLLVNAVGYLLQSAYSHPSMYLYNFVFILYLFIIFFLGGGGVIKIVGEDFILHYFLLVNSDLQFCFLTRTAHK